MKNSNFKSVLFASVIMVSAVSFVYVNTGSIQNEKSVTESSNVIQVANTSEPVKDTKMPDLQFVKSVLSILGKFTTAK